jgi:hypothetical protein
MCLRSGPVVADVITWLKHVEENQMIIDVKFTTIRKNRQPPYDVSNM